MKKIGKFSILFILCLNLLTIRVFGRELVAGGQVIGLELMDDTVTVAAFEEETNCPGKAAGLQVGDRISQIDGKPIRCAEDIRQALHCSKGCVQLTVWKRVFSAGGAGHHCGRAEIGHFSQAGGHRHRHGDLV